MPGEVMPPTKVFVGRLSSSIKSSELRKLFEKHGDVTECDILGTYGFVHMRTCEQADAAIEKLSGHELHGSRITVEHATGQRGRNRGGGGGGALRHYNGGGGYSRGMRYGGGGQGYRGFRGPERYEPYGRSHAGYGGYPMEYGMDRRSGGGGMSGRSAHMGGSHYDGYERRDLYARSGHGAGSRYADQMSMGGYDRRPSARADPYSVPPYSMSAGASHGAAAAGAYSGRRDEYGDMYGRRSPPRYQTDAGHVGVRGGGGGGYETYDRYGSPPRRYTAQHRELTAVRRY